MGRAFDSSRKVQKLKKYVPVCDGRFDINILRILNLIFYRFARALFLVIYYFRKHCSTLH
jgi:hypothetical protein